MNRLVRVRQLGVIPYSAGVSAQRAAVSAHQAALADGAPAPHQLLLLQHQPVYTAGRRRDASSAPDEAERLVRTTGAPLVRTDRGGLVTFHGPGQLVVYPLLNLRQLGIAGPRRYVQLLERAVVDTCDQLGVAADTSPHTGVWCGNSKVCAIGVHLTQRVLTSHGLALNCCVPLSWFDHIVPCGLRGLGVTSLSHQLGRAVSVQEAAPLLARALAARLGCELLWEDDVRIAEQAP